MISDNWMKKEIKEQFEIILELLESEKKHA